MRWDLDKLEAAYQEQKKQLALIRATADRDCWADVTDLPTIASLSNYGTPNSGTVIKIELLPRNPSEEVRGLAEMCGVSEIISGRVAILDIDVTRADGSGICISSFHEQWPRGYEDYVQHITGVVRALREKGYEVNYRHFENAQQRFIHE